MIEAAQSLVPVLLFMALTALNGLWASAALVIRAESDSVRPARMWVGAALALLWAASAVNLLR
jgi:hypothetical protein